jgi:hypothetical protein
MTVLGISPSKPSTSTVDQGSKKGQQQKHHEMSEEAKKLAANALAAVKDASAMASGRGKVEVISTYQHHTSYIFYYWMVDGIKRPKQKM